MSAFHGNWDYDSKITTSIDRVTILKILVKFILDDKFVNILRNTD